MDINVLKEKIYNQAWNEFLYMGIVGFALGHLSFWYFPYYGLYMGLYIIGSTGICIFILCAKVGGIDNGGQPNSNTMETVD